MTGTFCLISVDKCFVQRCLHIHKYAKLNGVLKSFGTRSKLLHIVSAKSCCLDIFSFNDVLHVAVVAAPPHIVLPHDLRSTSFQAYALVSVSARQPVQLTQDNYIEKIISAVLCCLPVRLCYFSSGQPTAVHRDVASPSRQRGLLQQKPIVCRRVLEKRRDRVGRQRRRWPSESKRWRCFMGRLRPTRCALGRSGKPGGGGEGKKRALHVQAVRLPSDRLGVLFLTRQCWSVTTTRGGKLGSTIFCVRGLEGDPDAGSRGLLSVRVKLMFFDG